MDTGQGYAPPGPTSFVSVDNEGGEDEEDDVGGHESHHGDEEVIHDRGAT